MARSQLAFAGSGGRAIFLRRCKSENCMLALALLSEGKAVLEKTYLFDFAI